MSRPASPISVQSPDVVSAAVRKYGRLGAIGLVSILSGLAHPTHALAEEDAEALILQGNHLRQRGDNERAHGYFKRAYEIARTGRTAAQLGLVEMAIQHFLDAEIHLSEALASTDAWVEKNRNQLEQTRDRGRSHLGRVEVHGAPTGTAVRIEGRSPIPVPGDGLLWAPLGQCSFSFLPPGRPEVGKQTVVSAENTALDLDLSNVPVASGDRGSASSQPDSVTKIGQGDAVSNANGIASASPAPPQDLRLTSDDAGASRRRTLRVVGLVTSGVGVASGVAGALLLRSGNAKVDAITADGNAGHSYNESNGSYGRFQKAGVALMLTGGAALTTGVVLFLLNRDPHQEASGTTVSIGVSPAGQIGFQLAGRLP